MRVERSRVSLMLVMFTVSGLALLSGCSHTDPAALEAFATDFLRTAAAALFL